jgi:transposase InsO family protein
MVNDSPHTKMRRAQYTSSEYAADLRNLDIQGRWVGSVNAGIMRSPNRFRCVENELIHRTAFPTKKQARRAVAEYIEVFCNRTRLHSGLGYKTPAEVAQQCHQNNANAA